MYRNFLDMNFNRYLIIILTGARLVSELEVTSSSYPNMGYVTYFIHNMKKCKA
jgi:hypothetical protein